MKTTLDSWQAANMLMADDNANWTRDQAFAIVDYLENLEDELNETIEFDAVGIRCDFSAYNSIKEFNNDWSKEYASVDELAENCITYSCADGTFVVVNDTI